MAVKHFAKQNTVTYARFPCRLGTIYRTYSNQGISADFAIQLVKNKTVLNGTYNDLPGKDHLLLAEVWICQTRLSLKTTLLAPQFASRNRKSR